jgi:para-nitrobenzyl esterase
VSTITVPPELSAPPSVVALSVDVPLLTGWNADEVRAGVVLAERKTDAHSFVEQTRARYGDLADALLKVYPASDDEEAVESAAALAGDVFIGYSTWKWIEMHRQTRRAPIYRYSFDRKIPVAPGTTINGKPATARDVGARHAGEIEYVFGTLESAPNVPWEDADRRLANQMMSYWSTFARSGEPSEGGLPAWPRYDERSRVMHLDEKVHDEPDARRAQYEALDAYYSKMRSTETEKPSSSSSSRSACWQHSSARLLSEPERTYSVYARSRSR